jgi:hypothetical protein
MFRVAVLMIALAGGVAVAEARPIGGRLSSAFVGEFTGLGPVCSLSFKTPQDTIALVGDYDECAMFYGHIERAKTSFRVIKVESSALKPLKDEALLKELRRTNPKAKFYRIRTPDLVKVLEAL